MAAGLVDFVESKRITYGFLNARAIARHAMKTARKSAPARDHDRLTIRWSCPKAEFNNSGRNASVVQDETQDNLPFRVGGGTVYRADGSRRGQLERKEVRYPTSRDPMYVFMDTRNNQIEVAEREIGTRSISEDGLECENFAYDGKPISSNCPVGRREDH